jgi:hypothetical protein
MDDRARALEDIAAIAREHGLTTAEIAAALEETAGASPDQRRRGVIVRVLAFLGGTFVFAGVGVFIALQWNHMNSAARVIVTLGSGLTAFVLAVLASKDERFERSGTPLLLVAAALEPTGMLVTFDEFGSGGDWRWASLVTGGTIALQYLAVFRGLRRSTPLLVAIAFGVAFWWTALDLAVVDDKVIALILGAGMILTAVGVDRSDYRDITPVWYLFGATAFLAGLFDQVKETPLEVLFLAAAAGFVYMSVVVHSRMLLVVATVAILAYTGWFTGQRFADSMGWPLALIAFGIFMIGLSAVAFRIDRDYVRERLDDLGSMRG